LERKINDNEAAKTRSTKGAKKKCAKCYFRKLERFDYKANLCRYELHIAAVEILHKAYGLHIVAVEIRKEYWLDIVAVEIHKG